MAHQHPNAHVLYPTGSHAPFLLRPIPGWVPLGQSPNAVAGAIAVPPLPTNSPIPPTTVACSHPGCNVRFSDVQDLQAHAYTLKHMPFACQFCTHRFVSCNDYIRHLFNIHSSDCKPPRAIIACWPICADCLMMCPDVWDAQKHGKEASHYPFQCFDCDGTRRACRTQTWQGFRTHQKTHHADIYGKNLLVGGDSRHQ